MANQSLLNDTEADQDVGERETKMRAVESMLREMRHRSSAVQKKVADREKTEAEKRKDPLHSFWNVLQLFQQTQTQLGSGLLVLDRVNQQLADRLQENINSTADIRDLLSRFHSEMMDLRDALNQAVNNTARAAETNNVNEKTLEDNQVGWEVRGGEGGGGEQRR